MILGFKLIDPLVQNGPLDGNRLEGLRRPGGDALTYCPKGVSALRFPDTPPAATMQFQRPRFDRQPRRLT